MTSHSDNRQTNKPTNSDTTRQPNPTLLSWLPRCLCFESLPSLGLSSDFRGFPECLQSSDGTVLWNRHSFLRSYFIPPYAISLWFNSVVNNPSSR